MSNNNNNNNNNSDNTPPTPLSGSGGDQKPFSSVFAYWDGKDKRIAQSQRLNSFKKNAPLSKFQQLQQQLQQQEQPKKVQSTPSLSSTVVNETTVVNTTASTNTTTTTSTNQDKDNNNNINENSFIIIDDTNKVVEQDVNLNLNNNNVKLEEGHITDLQSPDSSLKPKEDDEIVDDQQLIVGDDDQNNNNNNQNNYQNQQQINNSNNYLNINNYANFDSTKPIIDPNPDNSGIVGAAERDLEASKSASNYGSVYGSVYGSGYGYGADYTDDGEDDNEDGNGERDVSQERMLLLEILCERNSITYLTGGDDKINEQEYQNSLLSEHTSELIRLQGGLPNPNNNNNNQTTPTNYYISSLSRPMPSGYSHPNVLTSNNTVRTSLTSSTSTSTDESGLTSWNGEFQRLQEMDDCLEKFERLSSLEHDFVYAAESYGRIIISEHLLPDTMKTIKPVSVGGIAGGEKYIVQGIMFKFAVESDTYGLYGSDENAMKTAAHELNGCTAFLNCGVKGLHVPLMAYIDYRGFRLMALSLLPITKKTLVYGSSDAGQTVHTSNTMFNHLFSQAAKTLNLKAHVVEDATKGELRTLHGPIDIEGHVGTDGRFYLLDFARLSPPEPPVVRGAYLYRHLRLEFVRIYQNALCSDSFSPMTPINIEVHNHETTEAFTYLMTDVIPKFAHSLTPLSRNDVYELNLAKAMHAEGINMRYLGIVRRYSPKLVVREFLLIEAIERCLKSLTRELLRREMKKTHLPSDYPYKKIILNFINLVFGKSEGSKQFMNDILKPKLERKFKDIFKKPMYSLEDDENDDGDDGSKVLQLDFEVEENPLEDFVESTSFRIGLLKRYTRAMGIVLSDQCLKEFKIGSNITFVDPDIIDMTTKITRLNLIDFADGMALYYKALLLEKSNSARNRLLSMSRDRLEQSLSSVSTNYHAVFQLGNVIRLMARFHESSHTKIETYRLAEKTYSSLEKMRVEQNFLYLAKIYRGKTVLERACFDNYDAANFGHAITLFEESLALTNDKVRALYYIAQTLAMHHKHGREEPSNVSFQSVIDAFNSVLKEDPNHAKSYLAMGDKYIAYRSQHNLDDAIITTFYNRALELDPRLIKHIRPSVSLNPWLFFAISKTSDTIKEMITQNLNEMTVLQVPITATITDDDGDYFSGVTANKVILKNGLDINVRNLLRFTDHLQNFNFLGSSFTEETFLRLGLVKTLVSLNLGRCPGINDRCIEQLLTPALRKLKLYGLPEITDRSVRLMFERSINLEVLDIGDCENVTDQPLMAVAALTSLRKLAFPPSCGTTHARYAILNLPNLVSLDLKNCRQVADSFYGDAFASNASLVKVRGGDSFPHFMFQPQVLIMNSRMNDAELKGVLPGERDIFFICRNNLFGVGFATKNIIFAFNHSHRLVKFREYESDRYHYGFVRVGHFNIIEKPIWTMTMHKWSALPAWEVDRTFKMNFNGTFLTFQLPLNDITYTVNYQTLPTMQGTAFTCSVSLGTSKIMTASNAKTMRQSTIFEIHKPIPSKLFTFISCLLHPQVNR